MWSFVANQEENSVFGCLLALTEVPPALPDFLFSSSAQPIKAGSSGCLDAAAAILSE